MKYCFTCHKDVDVKDAPTHEKLGHDVQDMTNDYFEMYESEAESEVVS